MDIASVGRPRESAPFIQNTPVTHPAAMPATQNSADRLESSQNTASSSNYNCLACIWARIVNFFRWLFGAESNERTVRPTESAIEVTQPPSPKTVAPIQSQSSLQAQKELEKDIFIEVTQPPSPKTVAPIQSQSSLQAQKELEKDIFIEVTQPPSPKTVAPIQSQSSLQAQKELEKDIFISDDTKEALKKLMPYIVDERTSSSLQYIQVLRFQSRDHVFCLNVSAPNLVFKMARPGTHSERNGVWLTAEELTKLRFANMIKAQEVCTKHNLNLIGIPHARLFSLDATSIIAEERLNIGADADQEQQFKLSGLDETIRQIAIFIAKTGFNDVVWRNMHIRESDPAFQGSRTVMLIDLELMESASEGFYGSSNGSPGLIGCLFSEKQIEIALQVAKQFDIVSADITAERAKEKRIKELEEDQALDKFYAEKGILREPSKAIEVADLASLGLDLEEQGMINIELTDEHGKRQKIKEPVTLKQAASYVITAINKKIEENQECRSAKAKRHILLTPTQDEMLYQYNRLGLPPPPADNPLAPITKEELMQRWPWRVITALIKQGHLFKLIRENGHGYFIQA